MAQAVRADVDGWRDRWSVQVHTLDYGTAEASDVIEYAQGIGTDDARLFWPGDAGRFPEENLLTN